MNTEPEKIAPVSAIGDLLERSLQTQRNAWLQNPVPDYRRRRDDLLSLKRMLSENRESMVEAISRDFGNRSRHESLFAEFLVALDGINFVLRNLRRWMRVQKREIDTMVYPGARNRVIPQPVGVVGIIVPWNFPVQLAFTPLTYALAAGNHALVKMSENSRHLSRLIIDLLPGYFPAEKLQFFEETGGVGIEFSRLPLDHLFFTGSGATGRAVMKAAAENLTPVTLELGGKSPAVIAPDYPLKKAVERVLFSKTYNAGQICVNVDYLFLPEGRVAEFVSEAKSWMAKHCADIHSPDYTAIIDDRSFQRLQQSIEDARQLGGEVISLLPGQQADAASRKMPLHLVLNPNEAMRVMRREIFGPIMPILTYREPQEVVDYVTARDRPLAFYPFTTDKKLQRFYLDRVLSGGACVNDCLLHPAQHDLPFGGVGASGMGHYHGYEGFVTFSKLRPVFYQAGFSPMKFLAPPYGKLADSALGLLLKLKG